MARQVNQDTEPPQMRPLSPNVIKKIVMTPDPNRGKIPGADGPTNEAMLPAVNEELKSLEIQSLGGKKSTKRSNSRPRRSV